VLCIDNQNPLDSERVVTKLGRSMCRSGGIGSIWLCVGRLAAVALLCCSVAASAFAKADLTEPQAAINAGRYQEAVDLLKPILAADEKYGEAHFLLGKAYAGLERWSDAEASYNQAIDRKYREPAAYVGLTNALIALDRAAEVQPLLEKQLDKAKTPEIKAMFKNAIGRAEMAMGNYSKAQEWLLGARYDDEANLEYRLDLGDAYYKGQVYPLAASEYEAVLAADSSRLDVLYRLGEILYQQRRLNEARTLFVDLLNRDSTYHEAYFRLANIYMIAAQSRPLAEARDLYTAALALYRRVRAVDPNTDPVLVAKNIATVYYLINAYDSAYVELQNAINAGATDPELRFYLGRAAMLLGRYEEAIDGFEAYRKLLENADPPHDWTKKDAELFWRTAMCMESVGDTTLLPKIVENYRRAVQLDPDDERSIGGLALALHKLGRYAEAAVEFEKLVVRHPNEARYLFNASLPYMQLNNNEKAVEYLMRAAEDDTTAAETYRERGYKLAGPRLIKMGRTAEARECYQWLVKREPDVCDHRQWYAFTFFAAKNYTAAAPHLQRAYRCFEQLDKDPCKHNELRWWLAFSLYESGDKDASYELCEKVVECDSSNKDAQDLMDRIDEETIEEN
jgi:tetratricopeptide (TPR) repeat protein